VNPKGHDEEAVAPVVTFPLHTSPKEYLDTAREVCGMSWDRVESGLPRDAQPHEQNTKWCFSATYSYLFLTHGMGLQEEQSVLVQQTVGHSDIEWAIGAAYKEISDVLTSTHLRGY